MKIEKLKSFESEKINKEILHIPSSSLPFSHIRRITLTSWIFQKHAKFLEIHLLSKYLCVSENRVCVRGDEDKKQFIFLLPHCCFISSDAALKNMFYLQT